MDAVIAWMGWLALGCMAVGAGLGIWQYRHGMERKRHIDGLLAGPDSTKASRSQRASMRWSERLLEQATEWLDSKLGQQIVAAEDSALLVQCGYQTSSSKTYYLLTRLGLSIASPLMALLALPLFESSNTQIMVLFAAFAVGFLAPKWFLRRKAASRMQQANRELLVLVDLLGLLQGAGLGMDQSLQLIARDFRSVMPVLCGELEVVNRLHASGRTREQALQRLSEMLQSDALADLAALIVQIDKHGGAVQEPLRQFGERLREQRRMHMKEQIGKITVKMTGVMVVTLLPALLIIIAGPGFLSVVRALGGVQ